MADVPSSRWMIFLGLALGGCAADLLAKSWIFGLLGMPLEQPTWWLIDEIFGFTTSLNEGALFGFGKGQGLVFSALSVLALSGIVYWLFWARAATDLLLTIALGLITGGILGNLYDRLGLPGLIWTDPRFHEPGTPVFAVRDWIHFKIDGLVDWPIFNLADSLLVCGAALLIWHAFRGEPLGQAPPPRSVPS